MPEYRESTVILIYQSTAACVAVTGRQLGLLPLNAPVVDEILYASSPNTPDFLDFCV